jgi:hypothetical protein
MTKSRNSLLAGVAMTAMERRVGRYMRAPDHPTGDPAPAADPAPADDADPVVTPPTDPAPPAGGDDDGDDTALGGKKPDAADPADPAPEAPVVPEAYELTAPEGMTIDADMLTEATPIFKELGLSNEAASKVLPLAQSLIAKTQDATVQQFIDQGNQQRKAWLEEAKADPEIGGNKWDATLHTAGRGLDALGYGEGSALRTLLNETGLGNHPEMIKAMAKIGGMVGEDGDFVRADAGAQVKQSREEVLYPNDVRKEGA